MPLYWIYVLSASQSVAERNTTKISWPLHHPWLRCAHPHCSHSVSSARFKVPLLVSREILIGIRTDMHRHLRFSRRLRLYEERPHKNISREPTSANVSLTLSCASYSGSQMTMPVMSPGSAQVNTGSTWGSHCAHARWLSVRSQ